MLINTHEFGPKHSAWIVVMVHTSCTWHVYFGEQGSYLKILKYMLFAFQFRQQDASRSSGSPVKIHFSVMAVSNQYIQVSIYKWYFE